MRAPQDIDENQKALPTEAELPAFFETLNRKVLESGVEVSSWKHSGSRRSRASSACRSSIEMTGTFMQIKKFFASLLPAKAPSRRPATTPRSRTASASSRSRT